MLFTDTLTLNRQMYIQALEHDIDLNYLAMHSVVSC